jgi:hypothetical protein
MKLTLICTRIYRITGKGVLKFTDSNISMNLTLLYLLLYELNSLYTYV